MGTVTRRKLGEARSARPCARPFGAARAARRDARTRRERLGKEPLSMSHAIALQGPMRMNANRATKVVAETTMPRSAAKQAPHWAAARRDGVFRAVCFVARLAKGTTL